MSSKQPYMNVNADNALEEELLRATQARDSFANDIDQKTYDVMDTINPEQIRIEYLNNRITRWNEELKTLNKRIAAIDKDEQFNYEQKAQILDELIEGIRNEVVDYKNAYENEPEANLSAKATLKVALDEKKADLAAAEEIAGKFRKDEAEDIARASHMIKVESINLQNNIETAQAEIENIKTRLMSKKSGMKDIGAQNKDKEKLKELAKIVIDIKHRRQFPEQPIVIAKRLEQNLGLDLINAAFNLNSKKTETTSVPTQPKNDPKEENVEENKVTSELSPEVPNSINVTRIEEDIEEVKEQKEPEVAPSKSISLEDMISKNNIKSTTTELDSEESNKKLSEELDNYISNLGTIA